MMSGSVVFGGAREGRKEEDAEREGERGNEQGSCAIAPIGCVRQLTNTQIESAAVWCLLCVPAGGFSWQWQGGGGGGGGTPFSVEDIMSHFFGGGGGGGFGGANVFTTASYMMDTPLRLTFMVRG